MLTHPLAERLRGLGMAAMADAFLEMQNNSAAADLAREDWLGLLLDREATARDNKRLGRRLSHARLRQSAVVEDTDFRAPRGLDRALFHKLAGCDWIRHSQHLLIGGPTGTGKSWLACALGHKACREGFSVLYRRAPRLFGELATARGEGRLPRMLAALERTRLLIIDDWGPEPLTAEQRRDLLEIVEDRYEKGSLLITSQIPVARWHELIADPTIGDAVLDRVVHRAHRIELKGPSLRKRHTVDAPAKSDGGAAGGRPALLCPPPNPTALRYVTEIQPCPEVAAPKVSTRSATRNARRATAHDARPISQRLSCAIGGLSTGAPAYNDGTTRSRAYSPCKLNMPPGATLCRTVSATPPPPRPYRPSSISISMNSPPSCHRVDTVATDDHIAAHPGPPEKFSESRSCRLTNTREE
jgi:DNA replication protein DnaC